MQVHESLAHYAVLLAYAMSSLARGVVASLEEMQHNRLHTKVLSCAGSLYNNVGKQ
jgi:hypothetical protein